jgi:hypothetical protein
VAAGPTWRGVAPRGSARRHRRDDQPTTHQAPIRATPCSPLARRA